MRSTRRLLLLAFFLATQLAVVSAAAAKDIVVFAAASLKNALDDAGAAYEKETGVKALVSYAASSTLAKQVESGAPADIFISADLDWMDYLQKRNLIKPETRLTLLGNRLVLIAPANSTGKIEIQPGFALAELLGNERLAMADPGAVPAGKYGKAALEKLGAKDRFDRWLIEMSPEPTRPHEGLVVEPRREQRRYRIADRAKIQRKRRKVVLTMCPQALIQIELCRAKVGRDAAMSPIDRHQCVRFLGACRQNPARPMVLERSANQMHAIGKER